MTIADPDFLKKLLLSFMERTVEVIITPQMDETRPWLVTVEVPTMDGSEPVYFTDTTLEWALQKALDEYDRRDKARDVLVGPLKHGILKRDDK